MGLFVAFALVSLRLMQIQIAQSERFAQAADDQYDKPVVLPALRGSLLDRNGNPIASSTMFVMVEANPRNVGRDSVALVKSLSKITGKSKAFYAGLLKKGWKKRYVLLESRLKMEAVQRLALDTLRGVNLTDKSTRIYHGGIVAGQLLGITNASDSGIAGIEMGFNKLLTGKDGKMIYQKIGRTSLVATVDNLRIDPVAGHNITLTIDLLLQQIAESELERGVKENEAEGGIVIMLQPKTGEVLAVAQYPRVNPASFGKASKENQKLRAVTDMVEPGSVFKIVTASAALDGGLIRPEQKFNAENGVYLVSVKGKKKPRVIKDVHKYGLISFRESMELSSNIVMAKASNLIGNEKLYTMSRGYGFGTKTSIDIPAEIGGVLRKPMLWSALTRHSLSYGYEVGVTPIQIAAAYGAIANGGILMRPFILKRETDADGVVVTETEPAPVRRVVSEETAATLTSFLEGVVERGTAVSAKIPGMRIAGKTGTSKRLVNGSYEGSEYTASFVGFFPAEAPEIVCLVMLDKPRGINYYGGTTSAPIFREIVKRIVASSDRYALPIAGDVRDVREEESAAKAPVTTDPARAGAKQKPVAGVRTAGAGDGKSRAAEKKLTTAGTIAEKISAAGASRHIAPDVRGLSMREAINVLRDEKFEPSVFGSGVVVSQNPRPGEPVSSGSVIRLTCEPKTPKTGDLK